MTSSLEHIKSVSSTSSVTSVNITNCFSSDYEVYMLTVADIDLDGAGDENVDIRLLDSGGSVISASEYDWAQLILRTNAAFTENNNTSDTKFTYGVGYGPASDNGMLGTTNYFFSPDDSGSYTWMLGQTVTSATHNGHKYLGVHKSSEQITGIQILVDSGTIERLTANVYGLK